MTNDLVIKLLASATAKEARKIVVEEILTVTLVSAYPLSG